jgi:acetylornithine deacetylase/succinyl-diaminopimelate desuccinylase-like protein
MTESTVSHLTADEARRLVADEFPAALKHLTELVAIPGIAWESFDRAELDRSAEAVAELARQAGFTSVAIHRATTTIEGKPFTGGPAVVAQIPAPDGAPTVLLYAHHDVQPPQDRALWDTEPFTATEKNGRLYGRGTADDKAGVMVHLAAVRTLLRHCDGELPIGVTLFVEGEEEAGSPTFRAFLDEHADELRADAIVVADSSNWVVGTPALTTSLRGLVDGTITVRVAEHASHSGMFGGPVLDALTVLSRVIATLHDEQGDVAITGLHQAASSSSLTYAEEDFRRDAAHLPGVTLAGTGSLTERLWLKPALSVIGIDAPSVAVSSNTLLNEARAKISLRIAPGQDPEAALLAVQDHVAALDVFGAEVTFTRGEAGQPFHTETSAPYARAALTALTEAFGTHAVETGMGGSIPFIADLKEVYPQAEILVTGVEDPDTRAHSANESLDLGDFQKAICAELLLLARAGEIGRFAHSE